MDDGKFFISHSSADREFVVWLAGELRTRSIPVWFSDWEVRVGDSIVGKVDSALAEMAGLIVVLSRTSVNSKWVREELNAAFMRHLGDTGVRIFPVRIDDCQPPPILAHRRYADCSEDRRAGLQDLIASILPESVLVAEISSLKAACRDLLCDLRSPEFDDEDLPNALSLINSLLEQATEARYALEARHGVGGDPASGFFDKFEYLVGRGFELRNVHWERIVAMRNLFAHNMRGATGALRLLADLRREGERNDDEIAADERVAEALLENISAIFDELLDGPSSAASMEAETGVEEESL